MSNARIRGNRVTATDGLGIVVDEFPDTIVEHNLVVTPGEHGIQIAASSRCVVQGNRIEQPGDDADDTYDGIHLSGNSDDNLIADNHITPRSSGNQTRSAVNVAAAGCNNNRILRNFTGTAGSYGTAVYVDSGTATEWPPAEGTATITNGNSSVSVTHGLPGTPTQVIVTPLADPGDYFYVDTIGGTTFDINTGTAVGADTDFAWRAVV